MDAQPQMLVLLLALGAGASILLLGWAVAGGNDSRFERRLARAAQGYSTPAQASSAGKSVSVRRNTRDSAIPLLDLLLKRYLPNPEKLRLRLARTGHNISLAEYVLVSLLLAVLMGLAMKQLFGFPTILALPVAAMVGMGLPHLTVGLLGSIRIARFLEVFPDAVDLIVRGVRSGLPVMESLTTVGRELPYPVGVEFRRIGDAVRLGRSLEDAMWDVAKRLDTPEFKFLIVAMSIQRETGGNLADTLSNLSALLRRRRQLKLKIAALSSEAKASACIIGALPFIMFFLILTMNPDYAKTLLTDPRGMIMLGGALLMIALGAVVMGKMVRFEP